MKILILGATGRTGKWLLDEALRRNFNVNILVRDSNKIHVNNKNLQIFIGNPTNLSDLKTAGEGCSVVLNALNISRTSDFPWAKLRTPKDYLAKTMDNILKLNFEKIITISAWGVAESKKDIPFWFRWLVDFSNIKYGYLGHEQQEKLLVSNHKNYTIVRPVGLTNIKKIQKVIVSQNNMPKPNLTISRKMVAHFMLDELESNILQNQIVTISV